MYWTIGLVAVSAGYVFWDRIRNEVPPRMRYIANAMRRFLSHPVVFVLVAFGLLAASYQTGNRYLLIPLAILIAVFEVPRLRWRGLVRSAPQHDTATVATHTGIDLDSEMETVEGTPRAGYGDGGQLLELRYAGNSRNSFVLVKGDRVSDATVELDVLLKPNAILNVVVRCQLDGGPTGYMLRLDSRTNPVYFDGILKMTGGTWGELARSTEYTPSEKWVHVKACVTGQRLELFRDGQLVCSTTDGSYARGRIGFFNEVADAAIRNVVVS